MLGMNKNTAILGIVAILVIGGVVLYSINRNTSPVSNNGVIPTTQTVVVETTQARQPGIPVLVTDSNAVPTDTTVVVTGSVTPNGAFTNYWYEYSLSPSPDSKTGLTDKQSVGSGYLSIHTPAYIVGLTKDTTYYFRLVAENQYGQVAGAQYSFQTTHGVSAPIGSIPSTKTLSASGVSSTTATLNGEVVPNGAETDYWFEYGLTADLGNANLSVSLGNGNTKLTGALPLTDLKPLTTYYFRVDAQNKFGTVNGAILNFKTKR
jgi:hypothetical protein